MSRKTKTATRAKPAPTPKAEEAGPATQRLQLQFDDNRLLPVLYGEHDTHLVRLEQQLGLKLTNRGNLLTLSGPSEAVETARYALGQLWAAAQRGQSLTPADVDAQVRLAAARTDPGGGEAPGAGLSVRTKRRLIQPRSPAQVAFLQAMETNELVFGVGVAGTGKTYLAVAQAVAMLQAGRVERLVLSRPAVEAGERLGFLPGDMREKLDPYLRPIYDALYDLMAADQVVKRLASGEIEIAPLAFMRGRTLAHAFVILDEAQNTTPQQMKMALTRLGEGSRMVITGDPSQVDLPPGQRSGLVDALRILDGEPGIGIVRFGDQDVVRHPLVARIVRAYDQAERAGLVEGTGEVLRPRPRR